MLSTSSNSLLFCPFEDSILATNKLEQKAIGHTKPTHIVKGITSV